MAASRLLALLLVLAVVSAAGCGGGSSSRLTKAQYAAKANAICLDMQKQAQNLGKVRVDVYTPDNLRRITALMKNFGRIFDGEIDKLDNLKPPQELQGRTDDWLARLRDTSKHLDELGQAAETGDKHAMNRALGGLLRDSERADETSRLLGLASACQSSAL